MNDEEVGEYLNQHFVSTFQKVGTFRKVGNLKLGGNVASYFCTPSGRVLHLVAGPVDAQTFLRESQWAVDTWKLALLKSQKKFRNSQQFLRDAHLERLRLDHGQNIRDLKLPPLEPATATRVIQEQRIPRTMKLTTFRNLIKRFGESQKRGGRQAQVHRLLGAYPLVKLNRIYEHVFQRILREKVSASPVRQN